MFGWDGNRHRWDIRLRAICVASWRISAAQKLYDIWGMELHQPPFLIRKL